MQNHSEIVQWATDVIYAYIKDRKILPVPEGLSDTLLNQKAGVFVSIHTSGDRLRGCIGTIEATQKSIALEVQANAIAASTRDPRFPALIPEELDQIVISVDVLGNPEIINGSADLDPKVYGVIVESGYRKGLLLPDLEGVDTVESQISIARRKAGIEEDESVTLRRFRVTRYY
jgi:AmmeMemoRadiSam system protein A